MPIRIVKATTPGTRHKSYLDYSGLTKKRPEKRLTVAKKKVNGRNNSGKVTIRHRGGAQKRKLRIIDFKRNKLNIPGKVVSIEYDPNRTANIALINYQDGDKRYILAPDGLKLDTQIMASPSAEIQPGNALPLRNIPVGTPIHNLEIRPGKGGQIVRGAGTAALIRSKETKFATIALPSKEIRLFSLDCYATIGQLSNQEWKSISLGKAGRKRHMGWRPTVRGVAQHPDSHPHGGGEGRSGIGMPSPKSPWGKKTLGKKTRHKRKYSDQYILNHRSNQQ